MADSEDGTRDAVVSALPGDEFRACFWREVSSRSQEIFCEPVALWIVRMDGQVVGMVAGPAQLGTLVDAETLDNFLGFAGAGQDLSRYWEEARRRAESKQSERMVSTSG